jgi:thiamine-monophosphate kinase
MQSREPRRIALGPGAEFDLIRSFLAAARPLPPEVLVGPGDDAAVLEGGWVVTTDMSVEDVHFRRAWLSDREVGYRAGAAALSDLAAMAARPVAVLVSIAGSARGGADLEEVHAGVREIAAEVGAEVIGGDVSGSPGPLVLDVVALGRAERPLLRSGARPGDEVWVTGPLGAAAAAVRRWRSGAEPTAALRRAFARPRPRVGVARRLAELGAAVALIDLSDGLAGDAGHLAAASGVRITLEAARVPVSELAVESVGQAAALDLALHGGEDYELCFVTAPGALAAGWIGEADRAEGVALTRVGRVEPGEGVWLEQPDGASARLARGGFDHMSEERA